MVKKYTLQTNKTVQYFEKGHILYNVSQIDALIISTSCIKNLTSV